MEPQKTDIAAASAALPVQIRDPRIVMALPCYGGKIDQPFMQCVLHTLGTIDLVPFIDFLPGDSLVNRARNNLAHNFINGYPEKTAEGADAVRLYDWMLFIDTDLVFQPEGLVMLKELADKRGPGIYCGTYPIKQLKPKVVFNAMPGCKPDAEGIVEVSEAGTGYMMIHRDVFAKMIEKFGEQISFQTDQGDNKAVHKSTRYDFFTVGVYFDKALGYKRFLSEDWYFCQRWRECGGKIWMHTKIQCGHIGSFTYPGDANEVIAAAAHIMKLRGQEKKPEPLVVRVGPPAEFVPVAKAG